MIELTLFERARSASVIGPRMNENAHRGCISDSSTPPAARTTNQRGAILCASFVSGPLGISPSPSIDNCDLLGRGGALPNLQLRPEQHVDGGDGERLRAGDLAWLRANVLVDRPHSKVALVRAPREPREHGSGNSSLSSARPEIVTIHGKVMRQQEAERGRGQKT